MSIHTHPVMEPLDDGGRQRWLNLAAATVTAATGSRPSRVNEALEAAAGFEPQSPVAPAYRLWLADNLSREARYGDALHGYDAAIRSAQSASRLLASVDPTACALLHKAQAAALGRDALTAIAAYQELAVTLASSGPLFQAGQVAETQGDDGQAADFYLSAITQRPSARTDNESEQARRALQRLEDAGATYAQNAVGLADALGRALEVRDVIGLERLISKTHFSIGPLGGHTQFETMDLLEQFYSDLHDSVVTARRAMVGSGGKLYLRTSGWNGSWFRGDVICLLTRAPKGWQWTGLAIAEPHDVWLERWRPATRATNQLLPFTLFAPWPSGQSFRAGGLTQFAEQQAAVLAAGPVLGAALALRFSMNPCGFGPNGFYYNQGPTHDGADAFAIDFTRYAPNVPYDAESGGTPVLAARDGVVASVSAGRPSGDDGASNTVQIDHVDPDNPSATDRFRSRYLHLAGPFMIPVSAMMPVIAGQRLGLMDDTGNSVLDHLHFSIHDRTLPDPSVPYGRSVRPSPLSGVTLDDGDSATCVASNNVERLPGVNFRPTVISFGSVAAGETSSRILRVSNTAGAAVDLSFQASPPGPFEWAAFSGTLANGEERSFELTFRPVDNQIAKGTFTATSSDIDRPHSIGLSGKGIGGFPPPDGEPLPIELDFSPELLNFGSVAVGSTSSRTLTIRNETGARVNVSVAAPPSGSVFTWQAFSASVANGATRTVRATFRPASSAIAKGTLTVVSTAAGSPHAIGLLGKGPGGFPGRNDPPES